MSVQQIVDAFEERAEKLTEATFRKYVQLGLLPRSVRVGRSGKKKGSHGVYPASIVGQILVIKRLMSQGYTMDEIQKEFLFVRSDVEDLRRALEKAYQEIQKHLDEEQDELNMRMFREAKTLGQELLMKLESLEKRISAKARMERAAL